MSEVNAQYLGPPGQLFPKDHAHSATSILQLQSFKLQVQPNSTRRFDQDIHVDWLQIVSHILRIESSAPISLRLQVMAQLLVTASCAFFIEESQVVQTLLRAFIDLIGLAFGKRFLLGPMSRTSLILSRPLWKD